MATSIRVARAIKMKSKGKLTSKKMNKGKILGKTEMKKVKGKPSFKSRLKTSKRKAVSVNYDSSDDESTADIHTIETEDMDVADGDGDIKIGNEGWADVMTKILNSSKDKKSVILSKAQTDREVAFKRAVEKKEDFEVDPGDKNGDNASEVVLEKKPTAFKDIKKQFVARREEKKCWESMGRVKPDITARQKERALQRIATRGVVHLFNAVRQRQKTIEVKLKEVGGSEVKKEKILKSMTKGEFLDVLKNKAKSIPLNEASRPSNVWVQIFTPRSHDRCPREARAKGQSDQGLVNVWTHTFKERNLKSEDAKSESKPGWNIFCDDFMMGAKMKDWDKDSDTESISEIKQELTENADISSSDEG